MKVLKLLFENPSVKIDNQPHSWNIFKVKKRSIFFKAISQGLVDIVEFLINQTRVSFQFEYHQALKTSCRNSCIGVTKLLLRYHIFPIGKALNAAIRSHENAIVELLLADSRTEITEKNLIEAIVYSGNLTAAKMLLADSRCPLSQILENPSEEYFYNLVCKYSQWTEIVKMLLNDPSADPSANDNAAMRVACYNDCYEVVELLLTHPNVNPVCGMREAIMCENDDLFGILLADSRMTTEDVQYMFLESGRLLNAAALVKLIEDPRVDPSHNDNEIIREILSYGGGMECIQIVLKKLKIDLFTILQLACEYNSEMCIIELLEEYDVDPSAENDLAIRLAVQHSKLEVVKVLLKDSRVDPQPALHLACSVSCNYVSKAVLKKLASDSRVYITEKALMLAEYNHDEFHEILKSIKNKQNY